MKKGQPWISDNAYWHINKLRRLVGLSINNEKTENVDDENGSRNLFSVEIKLPADASESIRNRSDRTSELLIKFEMSQTEGNPIN